LRKLIKSLMRITAAVLVISYIMPNIVMPLYSNYLSDNNVIQKSKSKMKPMRNPDMRKYCSASVVTYKGVNFTLTNRHCCNAYKGDFPEGIRFVGDRIETIQFISEDNDVCVLSADQKEEGLRLAPVPASNFEKVMVFGFPRGMLLTPRFGHILEPSTYICILYDEGPKCEYAIISSTLVYPGNSGSPLLDMDGEIVGLVYGGNFAVSYGISVKLENVRKAIENAWIKKNIK